MNKKHSPSFGEQLSAEWNKFKAANERSFDLSTLTGAVYLENRLFRAFTAGANVAENIFKRDAKAALDAEEKK